MTYDFLSIATSRDSGAIRQRVALNREAAEHLRAERDRLVWLLAERDAEIHRLRDQLHDVESAEQRRMARELHDGLAQLTSAAHLQLQALSGVYHPRSEFSRAAFDRALECTRRAAQEVRRVIAGAPPVELDRRRLSEAIDYEVLALRQEGWDVTICLNDPDGLPFDLELALFRLVQESLWNIRKHAGYCSVDITLTCMDGLVCLEIRDHGHGFDPAQIAPGHYGLAGMRERVALLGGMMTLWSQPGAGAMLRVCLPLPQRHEV